MLSVVCSLHSMLSKSLRPPFLFGAPALSVGSQEQQRMFSGCCCGGLARARLYQVLIRVGLATTYLLLVSCMAGNVRALARLHCSHQPHHLTPGERVMRVPASRSTTAPCSSMNAQAWKYIRQPRFGSTPRAISRHAWQSMHRRGAHRIQGVKAQLGGHERERQRGLEGGQAGGNAPAQALQQPVHEVGRHARGAGVQVQQRPRVRLLRCQAHLRAQEARISRVFAAGGGCSRIACGRVAGLQGVLQVGVPPGLRRQLAQVHGQLARRADGRVQHAVRQELRRAARHLHACAPMHAWHAWDGDPCRCALFSSETEDALTPSAYSCLSAVRHWLKSAMSPCSRAAAAPSEDSSLTLRPTCMAVRTGTASAAAPMRPCVSYTRTLSAVRMSCTVRSCRMDFSCSQA